MLSISMIKSEYNINILQKCVQTGYITSYLHKNKSNKYISNLTTLSKDTTNGVTTC